MSLTVHLALIFYVFIAVAVMVCGHHGIDPTVTQAQLHVVIQLVYVN